MYASPEEYHVGRRDVARHLAFGGGPHRCVAAPLANVEIETAVRIWNRDLPGLVLVDPTPKWRQDWFFRGLAELVVRNGG
jgi:cytochrome P450